MTDAITMAMLEEIDRLRSLVEDAYEEGYDDGVSDGYNTTRNPALSWEKSSARDELNK